MTTAFRKFVIINPSELERLKEKRIRDYDQNLTALARLETNIESVLADESISLEEKLKLYNLLSAKFENIHSKCNKSNLQTSRAPTVPIVQAQNINVEPTNQIPLPEQEDIPQIPQLAQPEDGQIQQVAADKEVLPQVFDVVNIDNMLITLPAQYQSKFNKLLDIVKQFPGEISRSINNEIVISGKVIPETSFTDLFRNLYIHSAAHCNIGQNKFLQALVKCNINPNFISNSHIRTQYLKLLNQYLNIQTGKGPPPGKRPCILMLYKS